MKPQCSPYELVCWSESTFNKFPVDQKSGVILKEILEGRSNFESIASRPNYDVISQRKADASKVGKKRLKIRKKNVVKRREMWMV